MSTPKGHGTLAEAGRLSEEVQRALASMRCKTRHAWCLSVKVCHSAVPRRGETSLRMTSGSLPRPDWERSIASAERGRISTKLRLALVFVFVDQGGDIVSSGGDSKPSEGGKGRKESRSVSGKRRGLELYKRKWDRHLRSRRCGVDIARIRG